MKVLGASASGETDLLDRLQQVRFEAENLIRAGIGPRAAGELEWIAESSDNVLTEGIVVVLFLFKMDQPGGVAFPFPETFAREMKTTREQWMKDQTVFGQICSANSRRKLLSMGDPAIAIFLHLEAALRVVGDRNNVIKRTDIGSPGNSGCI